MELEFQLKFDALALQHDNESLSWTVQPVLCNFQYNKLIQLGFETTEKDELILLGFPQILSHIVFTSKMVINFGECMI